VLLARCFTWGCLRGSIVDATRVIQNLFFHRRGPDQRQSGAALLMGGIDPNLVGAPAKRLLVPRGPRGPRSRAQARLRSHPCVRRDDRMSYRVPRRIRHGPEDRRPGALLLLHPLLAVSSRPTDQRSGERHSFADYIVGLPVNGVVKACSGRTNLHHLPLAIGEAVKSINVFRGLIFISS
jgi:hypothetical protein